MTVCTRARAKMNETRVIYQGSPIVGGMILNLDESNATSWTTDNNGSGTIYPGQAQVITVGATELKLYGGNVGDGAHVALNLTDGPISWID